MTPPDAIATPAGESLLPETAPTSTPRRQVPPAARSRRRSWSKYLSIFSVSLKERMTYRGDFLLGTILRFLPMVTTILLWQAIYAGSQAGSRWRQCARQRQISAIVR